MKEKWALRYPDLSFSCVNPLAEARELYQFVQETTLQHQVETQLAFTVLQKNLLNREQVVFVLKGVYSDTGVPEARQAAVAKALPSKCLLNATESEKACHKITLSQ